MTKTALHNKISQKPKNNGRAICVNGSIYYQKDRGRYAINWYCTLAKRSYGIYRYKGEFMYHSKIADKCLAMIQARWEQHLNGECQFRIEEFTGKGFTDVIKYYEKWRKKRIKPKRSKATNDVYKSYYKNWIKPYFENHPIMLHEIREGHLDDMLDYILEGLRKNNPSGNIGKTAQNIMYAFHRMMKQGKRDGIILIMPLFPEKEDYCIQETEFDFLWEEDQLEIINSIPIPDRYPFLWLKYHYRRPSEACALYKTDYDPFNDEFTVRRSLSARKLWNRTKTGAIHKIPCDDNFRDVAKKLINANPESPFMFVNPRARKEGKRYTLESLKIVWKKACKDLEIGLYEGTKHSSCTQYINEKDGTDSELQMLTDHAKMASVKKYRKIGTDKKRRLMRKQRMFDKSGYFKATSKQK